MEHDIGVEKKGKKRAVEGKCKACGSTTHQRSNHKECPFNKTKVPPYCTSTCVADEHAHVLDSSDCSGNSTVVSSGELLHDEIVSTASSCTCLTGSRAHQRDCPMSLRSRYPSRRALFGVPLMSSSEGIAKSGVESALCKMLEQPATKKKKPNWMVGDVVTIHSKILGNYHVICRIVRIVSSRDLGHCYQLYCSSGVLSTCYPGDMLSVSSQSSVSLDKWRQAPKVSLRSVHEAGDLASLELCTCKLLEPSESIVLSSEE